jgi:inorganic pyrophosphatase
MQYDAEFWDTLDTLVNSANIVIDRPRGSAHSRYPEFIYEVDYGYLENTSSMDGGGIDVWKGTASIQKPVAVMCILDLIKKDSEIKILIGCTEKEILKVYETHNNSKYMKGVLIRR